MRYFQERIMSVLILELRMSKADLSPSDENLRTKAINLLTIKTEARRMSIEDDN